jgi:hypothetical protein
MSSEGDAGGHARAREEVNPLQMEFFEAEADDRE